MSVFPKVEERKDSDEEKSDRNRPWWKKRFQSAIPKGKESLQLLSSPTMSLSVARNVFSGLKIVTIR